MRERGHELAAAEGGGRAVSVKEVLHMAAATVPGVTAAVLHHDPDEHRVELDIW
jgi:hypothetical protein